MEKRALLAFVLSMAVFIAWTFLSGNPTQAPAPQAPGTTTPQADSTRPARSAGGTQPAEPAKVETAPNPDTGPQAQIREVTVRSNLYTAVFTEAGGRLKSLTLNKYLTTTKHDSPPKELVSVKTPQDLPLGLGLQSGQSPHLATAYFKADLTDINVPEQGGPARLVMTCQDRSGLEIMRTYSFTPGSYLIGLDIRLRNLSDKQIDDNLVLSLTTLPLVTVDRYIDLGAWVDNDLVQIVPKDVGDKVDKLNQKNYKLGWAAYEDQHFMAAVLPEDQEKTRLRAEKYADHGLRLGFVCPPLVMDPKTEKLYRFNIYYGPKDLATLKAMGNGLDRAVYFGWVDILSKPLLILMHWLYGFVGNYGIAIIIITVLIKICFWPLTAKSYKSMKAMQKLQPKIAKLRDKFKDDREAMNREMMLLYKTYKVNPFGGCLPMVIQIPVFIALYRLLDYSLELRHAPFWLWIDDLAAPDRLFNLGFHIPYMDPPTGIPVLTLLMGATMFFQQKLSPTPGDPTQAKIMMFLPLFFTVIFINFPAGLVLYWLVNNILSIGQQMLINKRQT